MSVETKLINIATKVGDVIDITKQVSSTLHYSNINSGIVTVFVTGSTAAVSIMECEPGLLEDMPNILEKIVPSDVDYKHNEKGDNNAKSHVKSTLLKPSLVVPFRNKKLLLGTWQQIILLEFDMRPRERKIIVQIIGD